ncbi:MAG: transglutaminase domain-containing protein, partial [Spirochaetales bacterium]|nr:transglutaminase domain-containing protein [Spirochaetales bacterium]
VMIVESELSFTYLASRYFTVHDGRAGFTADEGNYLNGIARTRYVETWKNPHTPLFAGREGINVFVLSVESTRGIPYFPYSVEPTISDRTYYPFLYSWNSLSLVTDPRRMVLLNFIDSYPDELPVEAQDSLQLDLTEDELKGLDDLLATLEWEGKPPYARFKAILNLYRDYQYNMGYTEDWTTGHILDFLENTREGDCTEFANGAALMARRMGIPARVVTGYLASEDLQTPNHKKALSYLKNQIPPLADKDLSRLFLVTTSHKHAWIQCWFPEFGWVDMETTGTAIPPSGSGDPNKLDVVIPMITETVKGKGRFIFPWRIVLRVILGGAVLLLATAYAARIILLIRLTVNASRPGEGGYKAAYRLVLMRWADRGKPPRERQMTPKEYARICPELSPFTEAFMEGVYGSGGDGNRESWERMRGEYRALFREDRSLLRSMREAVSLKGLYYGFKNL